MNPIKQRLIAKIAGYDVVAALDKAVRSEKELKKEHAQLLAAKNILEKNLKDAYSFGNERSVKLINESRKEESRLGNIISDLKEDNATKLQIINLLLMIIGAFFLYFLYIKQVILN